MRNFIWYDFETWGLNPQLAGVASFAGILTDDDFNIIEKFDLKCKPTKDRLISPTSALITKIDPYELQKTGLPEYEFSQKIQSIFTQGITTKIGYNNSHFDDIVLRFLFFRNLSPAYAHEANPNASLDLLDIARLIYALRPENIEWPVHSGRVSFKLEQLAIANSIEHNAHDAMSDVEATIGLAKIFKQKKAELWQYIIDQHQLPNLQLKVNQPKIYLYINRYLGIAKHYIAPVILFSSPSGKNYCLALDLSQDLQEHINKTPEELLLLLKPSEPEQPSSSQEAIVQNFTATKTKPLALFSIKLKQSPVIVPIGVLTADNCKRLNLDLKKIEQNFNLVIKNDFLQRLQQAFGMQWSKPFNSNNEEIGDIDGSLYTGGFIGGEQQRLLKNILQSLKENKDIEHLYNGLENNLQPLVQQFLFRHFPQYLTADEQLKWSSYIMARNKNSKYYCYNQSTNELHNLFLLHKDNKSFMEILNGIGEYNSKISKQLTLQ